MDLLVVIAREAGDYTVATSMTPPEQCQVHEFVFYHYIIGKLTKVFSPVETQSLSGRLAIHFKRPSYNIVRLMIAGK